MSEDLIQSIVTRDFQMRKRDLKSVHRKQIMRPPSWMRYPRPKQTKWEQVKNFVNKWLINPLKKLIWR